MTATHVPWHSQCPWPQSIVLGSQTSVHRTPVHFGAMAFGTHVVAWQHSPGTQSPFIEHAPPPVAVLALELAPVDVAPVELAPCDIEAPLLVPLAVVAGEPPAPLAEGELAPVPFAPPAPVDGGVVSLVAHATIAVQLSASHRAAAIHKA
jgi:hypothetical protein